MGWDQNGLKEPKPSPCPSNWTGAFPLMKKFFLALIVLGLGIAYSFALSPINQTPSMQKKYRCPICGLILVYSLPGIYECPSDRTPMTPVIE